MTLGFLFAREINMHTIIIIIIISFKCEMDLLRTGIDRVVYLWSRDGTGNRLLPEVGCYKKFKNNHL